MSIEIERHGTMADFVSVLMIVDVQAGFVTDHSRGVVDPLARLQDRFGHVVVTKFHNPDPSPFRGILDYHDFAPGAPETALAFTPRADALVVDRPLYTAVTEDLMDRLRRWNATDVFIGGIATEACILKTAVDLFERSVTPWLIEDLCASDKGPEFHDPAIKVLGKLIDPRHIVRTADLDRLLPCRADIEK